MIITVDGYGACIKKHRERFIITNGEEVTEYSAKKVEQLFITSSCLISSDAIKLAMDNEVDVVFMSRNGIQYARLYGPTLSGPVATRRKQLEAATSNKGKQLAVILLSSKLRNMANLLSSLHRTRKLITLKKQSTRILHVANHITCSINLDHNSTEQLFGFEGEGSKLYFSALSTILKEKYYFGKRSKHPAKDIFNAYLNYGYGILYAEVERACLQTGLDPYIGIQHSDKSNKKSFVYDFIEQFRQPIVDREVINLFGRKQVHISDVDDKFYLNSHGKALLVPAIMNKLEKRYYYGGENISLRSIIAEKARECVNYYKGKSEYEGFVPSWL